MIIKSSIRDTRQVAIPVDAIHVIEYIRDWTKTQKKALGIPVTKSGLSNGHIITEALTDFKKRIDNKEMPCDR